MEEPKNNTAEVIDPVANNNIELDVVDGSSSTNQPYSTNNVVTSTGTGSVGGRQLTFKDYGEKIKELEGENFQLKVRIHLMENARYGKRNNPQQNPQNHPGSDVLGTAASEIVTQFQQLKKINEALNLKLVTADNHYKKSEDDRRQGLEREEDLINRNQELQKQVDLLDRELALVKWKKAEDEEVEKCIKAFNNFGTSSSINNNNSFPNVDQVNALTVDNEKLELQIQSLKDEIANLKIEIAELRNDLLEKGIENEKLHQKARKRHEQVEKLRAENSALHSKVNNACMTMRDMGYEFNDVRNQNTSLATENEDLKKNLCTHKGTLEQLTKMNERLLREKALLKDKLSMSEKLHNEYGKLVTELKTLRTVCPVDNTYERYFNVGLTRSVSHQEIREDPSPDLGIETDPEALVQQVASADNLISTFAKHSNKLSSKHKPLQEHRDLQSLNMELANKLRSTKQALDMTLHKLDKTEKEKEEFEKAICRQLHKTHSILQDAQKNIEAPAIDSETIASANTNTQSQNDRNYSQFIFTQKC